MPNRLTVQSNDVFNYWTVIKEVNAIHNQRQFFCKCKCGKEKRVAMRNLRNSTSKSCGCIQDNKALGFKRRKEYYHLRGSRLYRIYNGMKGRCTNKNANKYKYYGLKGVKVCTEWVDNFMSFYNWAMNNNYNDDLTIERIDVNGNYEPSNCKWVTMKEQCSNRTSNIPIIIDGVKYSIYELSKLYNIKYSTIYMRLKRGWDIKDALKINVKIANNQSIRK